MKQPILFTSKGLSKTTRLLEWGVEAKWNVNSNQSSNMYLLGF